MKFPVIFIATQKHSDLHPSDAHPTRQTLSQKKAPQKLAQKRRQIGELRDIFPAGLK